MFTLAARDMGDHVESLTASWSTETTFRCSASRGDRSTAWAEDDVAAGAHPVVVLSHDYWQRAYGGDPKVVGQPVRLSGRQYTIVGVTPAVYSGMISGLAPSVFVPIKMINQLQPDTRDQLTTRGNHSGFLKARLVPAPRWPRRARFPPRSQRTC
jgi:hypothetical protein